MSAAGVQRCGYAVVLGPPNAGKSTLVNRLAGGKVSIVSPKVQTTRSRVTGIAMADGAQVIFLDTPGLFQPDAKNRLEQAIVSAAWSAVSDGDTLIFLLDAARDVRSAEREILDRIFAGKGKTPCALVLNKIDTVPKDRLLALAGELNDAYDFSRTYMISAEKGQGTDVLMRDLAAAMPEGPYLYDEEQMSDMPLRLLAAEITREKVFLNVHQEVPYGLTVETESWEEFQDGSVRIGQVVITARDAHRKILLGKGGAMIKRIGSQSRRELEEILERRCHLNLFVKTRADWQNKAEHFALWGLDPGA